MKLLSIFVLIAGFLGGTVAGLTSAEEPGDVRQARADMVREQIGRLDVLVNDLLAFARPAHVKRRRLDLARVATQSAADVSAADFGQTEVVGEGEAHDESSVALRVPRGLPPHTTDEGIAALVEKPASVSIWNGPYLKKKTLPKDPWGNDYNYRSPGQNGPYDLFSLGQDNMEGGEDENEDIVSW